MFNKDAIIAATMIIAVGLVGYFMAANERAMERCQEIHSADTCAYVMR